MPEARIVLHEGTDDETIVPARWEVCPRCDGRKELALPGIAFTESDMFEAGEEFREDYFAGRYDEPCPECKGEGLVAVPDEGRCTPAQLAEYDAIAEADAEYEAMRRSEIAFGC